MHRGMSGALPRGNGQERRSRRRLKTENNERGGEDASN
jgi:hypothetical protein